jgi:SAM-dependent methyltransferase
VSDVPTGAGLLGRLRAVATQVAGWPIHPQWASFRLKRRAADRVARHARGVVLDIGCNDRALAADLPAGCTYLGLDYPATGRDRYGARPDVYGDGQQLPLAEATVDCVVLLDVLEHLPDPERCLREAARVLHAGGELMIHVPFAYPLHDEPFDFLRPTSHALRRWLAAAGLEPVELEAWGTPGETAALWTNLALAGTIAGLIARSRVFVVLLPVLLMVSLGSNLIAAVLSLLGARGRFMPISHWVLARKARPADAGA